jgi:hypothetical protein
MITQEKFDEIVMSSKNPFFSFQRRPAFKVSGFTFVLFRKGSFTTRMCKECVHNNRDHDGFCDMLACGLVDSCAGPSYTERIDARSVSAGLAERHAAGPQTTFLYQENDCWFL